MSGLHLVGFPNEVETSGDRLERTASVRRFVEAAENQFGRGLQVG